MRPFMLNTLRRAFLRPSLRKRQWLRALLASPSAPSEGVRTISLMTTEYKFDDYNYERENFSLPVPEHFNFARDFIDAWAKAEQSGVRDASVPAFWWVDGATNAEVKWSFQYLSQQSQRVANALVSGCGLQSGDPVILVLPKLPEWWMINVACIRANLITSPGTVLLRSKDIEHRLRESRAKCIITIPELCHLVDETPANNEHLIAKIVVGDKSSTPSGWKNYNELVERAGPDFECVNTKATDPMTIFFTSGTTGSPKMALHSHASYGLGHTKTARYFLRNTPRTIVWNLSDPGWAKCAWSSFFTPWIHGSCVFIHHSTGPFDPAETIRVLSTYPISLFCSSPTGYRFLISGGLAGKPKFKALKRCLTAGEPANPELIELWKKGTDLTVLEGYGQTETTLICARYECIPYKPGSMGKASPGVDLAILDNEGQELEPNIEGNLAMKIKPHRPLGLFTHYMNDPEKNAASFQGDYYLLGDRSYMDEEGYVFFVGRSDDVIISAGYRIGPFEIESALLEHPAVVESAVVSSPDETRGSIVKAFVILHSQYLNEDKAKLTKDLQDYVKSVTAPYKYPREIEFVSELPKTISGKIRRIELREKEKEHKKDL